MTLENILNKLPDYAKDLRLNFSSLVSNHADLTEQQFWGTVLASAMASRNTEFLKYIKEATTPHLNAQVLEAVNIAVAIMAMNNIYYRFTHLIENTVYRQMPVGLRMNMMREAKVEKIDFEIWSLAVSIINGCGMCITAHEKQLEKAGVKPEVVQFTAKIAAVIHAIAVILENL